MNNKLLRVSKTSLSTCIKVVREISPPTIIGFVTDVAMKFLQKTLNSDDMYLFYPILIIGDGGIKK